MVNCCAAPAPPAPARLPAARGTGLGTAGAAERLAALAAGVAALAALRGAAEGSPRGLLVDASGCAAAFRFNDTSAPPLRAASRERELPPLPLLPAAALDLDGRAVVRGLVLPVPREAPVTLLDTFSAPPRDRGLVRALPLVDATVALRGSSTAFVAGLVADGPRRAFASAFVSAIARLACVTRGESTGRVYPSALAGARGRCRQWVQGSSTCGLATRECSSAVSRMCTGGAGELR